MIRQLIFIKLRDVLINTLYRIRLRNDDFTIIANTCIAGIMYHKLGKKFLSPTINLWMEDEDFIRFVRNLDDYLSQPLRFVNGIDATPTAFCGDVLIHFNHYKTNNEAETKWNERKLRINKHNLFIICSDRTNPETGHVISHEDMLSLKEVPCRGKVVFSVRKYDDIDYIVPLPQDSAGEYVNEYMYDKTKCLQRWRWETAWDWVRWLNDGVVRCKE